MMDLLIFQAVALNQMLRLMLFKTKTRDQANLASLGDRLQIYLIA
jgi:hypothetical protein